MAKYHLIFLPIVGAPPPFGNNGMVVPGPCLIRFEEEEGLNAGLFDGGELSTGRLRFD